MKLSFLSSLNIPFILTTIGLSLLLLDGANTRFESDNLAYKILCYGYTKLWIDVAYLRYILLKEQVRRRWG